MTGRSGARSGAARPPTTRVQRLAGHLLDGGPDDALAAELAGWLEQSPRFRTFSDRHRDKIRKKLRGAADPDARLDVRAELQAAHLLLADRRTEVAFEAYGSGRVGPDFTVTVRGTPAFNVEVTRLRGSPSVERIGGVLLVKLRQLPPSVGNMLIIAIDGGAEDDAVAVAVQRLRTRADRKDEAFFTGRGLAGTRDFYDRFLRLGAVVLWCEREAGDARATLWLNGSAQIALLKRATDACLAGLRAG